MLLLYLLLLLLLLLSLLLMLLFLFSIIRLLVLVAINAAVGVYRDGQIIVGIDIPAAGTVFNYLRPTFLF